jgi:hypothetical protein
LATKRAEALREALGARDRALGDARRQAERASESAGRARNARSRVRPESRLIPTR